MKEIFSIDGKKILITGASSGIGRQLAITLASLGAIVTVSGRNAERLNETLALMQGDKHTLWIADLALNKELKTFKPLANFDGVVFNAGVIEYLPVKFLTEEKIKKIFDINFNSAVLLCQHLLKNRFVNKGGSLIFISSVSSILGVSGTALYASSKAAINAFSKVVASEVAPQRIRSNSICPGIITTEMNELARTASTEAEFENASKAYPLGYGTPTDIAGLVAFLLSDSSHWITGGNLVLDGGLTLS